MRHIVHCVSSVVPSDPSAIACYPQLCAYPLSLSRSTSSPFISRVAGLLVQFSIPDYPEQYSAGRHAKNKDDAVCQVQGWRSFSLAALVACCSDVHVICHEWIRTGNVQRLSWVLSRSRAGRARITRCARDQNCAHHWMRVLVRSNKRVASALYNTVNYWALWESPCRCVERFSEQPLWRNCESGDDVSLLVSGSHPTSPAPILDISHSRRSISWTFAH